MAVREELIFTAVDFDPFAGPDLALTVPATEAQREIWTATRMGRDASCAFNESNTLRLAGPLNVDALRLVFTDLVERHSALRSTFSGDGAMLLIASSLAVELPLHDLSALSEQERSAAIQVLKRHEVEEPFDLEQGPLVRAQIVRLESELHLLVFTAHHLVCDGWSTGVLLRDLAALYSARVHGASPNLRPAFQFSAYAAERLEAEQTEEYAEAERWWVEQFSNTPPALDLPFDSVRPALKTYNSVRRDAVLDPELVSGLKRLATASGASFFTVLFAAFDVLLHRLSGAADVVVGIPSAGQATTGHPDLVGHCVNTLPIRCGIGEDDSFTDLIAKVRAGMLDATERPDYTFGRLVRKLALPRDASRLPLVSVLFNLDQEIDGSELRFDGLTARFESNPRAYENFDLFLNAVEADGWLRLECQFNTDLLRGETVERWFAIFETLLRSALATPEKRVAELQILPAAEARLLAEWNRTDAAFARDVHIDAMVTAQVERTPDAVAVVSGDDQLTYAELHRRSNQLARYLRKQGAARGTRVGLCLERNLDMVVALLAVSKADAAYVPLDPAYPAERLSFMIGDSGMSMILTHDTVRHVLPASDARVISIDAERSSIASESDAPSEHQPDSNAEDPIYVIYTSGSTGKPKGVLVPHRSVSNLLECTRTVPGMNSNDVVVAITTLSFDIAGYELWLPLTVGATIVVAPPKAGGDGPLLLELMRQAHATILQATPATWRLLIDAGWDGNDRIKAVSTGEALPLSLARELGQRAAELWNMYGPTETTVWSSYHRMPRHPEHVPIGRPMANTQLHILDRLGQPVPIGVPGELYIGGDGVTLGYLDRPELTGERFIGDPFSAREGAKLYRTGDVTRWQSDGTIEYLGRSDYQVKVRGFRIELGEIEAVLARHSLVSQTVVMAREDRPGDVRLVAYVVPSQQDASLEETLRSNAQEVLPDYMVPQHFVAMDKLPLTPNGKVNRAALPAPQLNVGSDQEYVAPRNEHEQLLAEIWQELLGMGRVGIHDDFFQLGGHSLLAAKVVSRIARDHGIALAMRSMFEAPTIAKFAPLLNTSKKVVKIPRRDSEAPAAASIMQRRSLLLEQIGSGVRTFNLPAAWRLTGALDADALEYAINAFARRQEATRTTLRWYGERVVQTIAPSVELHISHVDLRDVPSDERESVLVERLLSATDEPFDLAAGPLIRVKLFRTANEEHVLFLLVHHAIWDGWSFDIFVREIDSLYRARLRGDDAPVRELPIRYTDFAEWHNEWLESDELAEQRAYWHQQLGGDLAPLELPTDRPRPKLLGDAGATEWVDISGEEADALSALGRREGVTLFVVLLAAYQTMLHRYSGQAEFLVGTPVRGRAQPELEDVVGWFVNTVVLRSNFKGAPSFQQVLQRVRATVLDAFSHQDVQFEHLLTSRNPAYRAFFSYQDARNRPTALGNLGLRQVHVLPAAAANDISIWIMQNDHGLVGGLNYSTELFDRATMQQFLASFRQLLREIVADPSRTIDTLPLVPGHGLTPAITAESSSIPPALAPVAFSAHVAASPASTAIVADGRSVTYAELKARADAMAIQLERLGIKRGSRVALCNSGIDRVIGLVAIARVGAAAIPMDPAESDAWLTRVAEASQADAAIIAGDLEVLFRDARIRTLTAIEAGDGETHVADVTPADLAMVAYTFGPDGEPIGVELTHGALATAISAVSERVALDSATRMVGTCSLGSGRSVLETWLPLYVGATIISVDSDMALGPQLTSAEATAMHAEPATWRHLLETGWTPSEGFVGLSSGAPCPPELQQRLESVYDVYGQAETCFWAGINGSPVPGSTWYVVDSRMTSVPNGMPGELLVSGADGLLVGTGDRVRMRGDGAVDYLGRIDDRLSLAGSRLHAAPIEAVLAEHRSLRDAAVAVRDDAGEPRLVAWVVLNEDADYTDSELRRWLRKRLPAALVPGRFLELPQVPRLHDGSVDRSALPSLDDRLGLLQRQLPRTEAERLLGDLWRDALSLDEVGVHDNFFDLGGHSLACIQVISRLERASGLRLDPRWLLLNTLEQVAAQLEERQKHMATSTIAR